MNAHTAPDTYGRLADPTTLVIQRVLPGPAERVWDYLTRSDLRRQWLASGEMEQQVGAPFTLTWRNDELSDVPGKRPETASAEHSLDSEITVLEPNRKLAFTWGSTGGVTFELAESGKDVILTVTHRRVEDPTTRLNISAGWHAHLDVLALRLAGRKPETDFWSAWQALKAEYTQRLAG